MSISQKKSSLIHMRAKMTENPSVIKAVKVSPRAMKNDIILNQIKKNPQKNYSNFSIFFNKTVIR